MNKILFSSIKGNWTTPIDLFLKLDAKYHFTLDACADDINHLCDKYYTEQDSCLNHSWCDEIVYINPPYSHGVYKFVKKCYDECNNNKTKIVLLIPSRTDTRWWHDFIYNKPNIRYEFIKGRLKFGNCNTPATFPSVLVYFNL